MKWWGVVKMEKIHSWPAVMAMSLTRGITYVVCALLVAISPSNAVSFFNVLFHGIDLSKIMGKAITISSFFIGLIEAILITALLTLIFVTFYNLCLEHCIKRGWIRR